MRTTLLSLAVIAASTPLLGQETRFTHEIAVGGRLELQNINGSMNITPTSGRIATIVVTKTVKRGKGDKVRAIMDESGGSVRVCTLDSEQNGRNSCGPKGDEINKNDKDDVVMSYNVQLPTGVTLAVETVNGDISAKGVTRAEDLVTVNGSVSFDGESAGKLTTVNGSISAKLLATKWTGTLHAETVNGSVSVSLPASTEARVHAETVSGSVRSDFAALTSANKPWQHSIEGQIGAGGRLVELSAVNGGVSLLKQ